MTASTLLPPPSHLNSLVDIAQVLVVDGKGLLAIDDAIALRIARGKPARRAYRELILTTPGLGNCITEVILHNETVRPRSSAGATFLSALADAGSVARPLRTRRTGRPVPKRPGGARARGAEGTPR